MTVRISLLAGVVSATLLAACSSDDDALPTGGEQPGEATGKLRVLGSGEAFLDAIREGLIAQNRDYHYPVEEGDEAAVDVPTSNDSDAADGGGETADGSGGSDDSGDGNEVTSTNVQELGVDEQDWVKVGADGNHLYVLDSQYWGYYDAIAETAEDDVDIADGVVADELPGTPSDWEPPPSTLRILALDADAPDASSVNDLELDLEGRHAAGFYLYESQDRTDIIISASGSNYWGLWSEPAAFGGRDSLITRVDVSDALNAAQDASLKLDGQIISSRRIGQYLFLATRFYPQIDDAQPYQMSPEQWRETVDNASSDDLIPHYSLDGSEQSSALIDPANCFVSDSANGNDYYTPDVITLSVFDLDSWQFSDSECYLGATETLYASPQAVFLATTQYDYSSGPVVEQGGGDDLIDPEDGAFPADVIWYDPRVTTDIHQFDIDAGQLSFAGSGTVDGHLGWNPLRKPFRMSERNGYLRVATMNDRQGPDESPILLHVLRADGAGELENVASLPNDTQAQKIGKPGEQLYASRFLGDRAYLVTFRQTDPLYVIDLANPEQPVIGGELEIAGYSDYLHPIDEDYLLGIGKDAVASPDGDIGDGRGALVQGLKLALFNVSDPAAPTEVQSLLIGQRGTHSHALGDHRAITVQTATDEHPTRVSFGIDVHGEASPASSPVGDAAFNYYSWNYSGLHGFDIRTGSDAGITPRGALVVDSAASSDTGYNDYREDRSVMVNDSVFYVRGDRVYAAPWDNLASPTPAR